MKHKSLILAVFAAAATNAFAQSPQVALRPAPAEQPRQPAAQSRDEFLQRAAHRFDVLDADKDGKITPAERMAARRAPGPHAGHHAEGGQEHRHPGPHGAPEASPALAR